MDAELLKKLSAISKEEAILKEQKKIDKNLYFKNNSSVVDSKKFLDASMMIRIRPHTRFVHFPKHQHNYIEMTYVCSGKTVHIINGAQVELHAGEILILNQNAIHEVLACGEEDVAVNFIILPEFFDRTLAMMGDENNALKDFLISCICSSDTITHYLHFKVAGILPVQNLIEILIWNLTNSVQNKHFMNQTTMGLLFLQLMNYENKVDLGRNSYAQEILFSVFQYIEEHYRNGELTQLANQLNCEFTWLSKEIKKLTGFTYTELIQNKRLEQACYLLKVTDMSVTAISLAVGYDNFSYFYRLFKKKFGLSPRAFRINPSKNV